MKYDREKIEFELPDENLLGVLKSRDIPCAATEEEAVRKALENPIDSPRIGDKVKPGEKVCVIICDLTRAWQHTHVYLPMLLDEIKRGGARDEDIFFISATGTHRGHTPEEHKILLGEKLYGRYKIFDHNSTKDEMADFGKTSRGTPVLLNKKAVDADHVVLTGAISYHFMAGWGGGRKAVLPGISAYKTVMANHALTLNPPPGNGRNMVCRTGSVDGNILHLDMMEAASKIKPSFLFNVVMNASGQIGWAVAGDWRKAYEAGTAIVDSADAVPITQLADVAVASACGFPKDINFYQASKTVFNAQEAVRPGGAMVILAACSEGFGNEEMQMMLQKYKNSIEREAELRREFTIAKYVGYCVGQAAELCDMHLVTKIDPALLDGTGIIISQTLEEAMEKVYAKQGKGVRVWLMPQGANTLPKLAG